MNESIKHYENEWKSLKIDDSHWKNHESHCKSMTTHWKPMKIEYPSLEGLTPCGALWQPVAGVWTPLYIDFSILEASCLLDDECKIDGSGAGAWRLLDDEWQIGKSSHTLEPEELGG